MTGRAGAGQVTGCVLMVVDGTRSSDKMETRVYSETRKSFREATNFSSVGRLASRWVGSVTMPARARTAGR
jgi:hypothetical protein